jgi:D-arabinose 1-dehydrogenase-like Zn-dependent alcohol dehydrogenase
VFDALVDAKFLRYREVNGVFEALKRGTVDGRVVIDIDQA